MAEIKIYGTLVNDTNEAIVKSTQVAATKQDGTAATQSAVNADLYAKYAAGIMSSSDKTKLDGIAAGAQVNVIEAVKVNGTALSVSGKSVNIDLSPYAKSADTIHVADVAATATDMNLKLRKKAGDTPICNAVFHVATTSAAGLMSAADKTRLEASATAADLNAAKSLITALTNRVAALEAALTLK